MTDQETSNNTERQRLLDQILDPTTRPVLLAFYSRLHGPRPHHADISVTFGIVHSLPTFADDYARFTVRVYNRAARTNHTRIIRMTSPLFAASCPDLQRNDYVEMITVIPDKTKTREAIYLRRVEAGETPMERLIELLGALLALQLPAEGES
jgi:hypothetical protein